MPNSKKSVKASTDRLARWFEVSRSGQPSFSHDGSEVLFISDSTGLPQAWRVSARGGEPRLLRESRDRIGWIGASPTRPQAIVAQDAGGNEVWQLELLSLSDDSGRTRSSRRPITADPKVMNLPGRWMSDGRRYLYSSNARNRAFFDVYRFDVDDWSPPERISTGDAWQEATATRGDRVLIQRNRTNIDVDLFLIEPRRDPVHLNPHDEETQVNSATIGEDGVYVATNPGIEFVGLYRFPFDGTKPTLVLDCHADVELVRASPDASHLAVVVNRDGWSELRIVQVRTGRDQRLAIRPRGVIEEVSWNPDGLSFAYSMTWPNGHDIFVFDFRNGRSRRLTQSPVTPPRQIREPKLASVKAQDGLTVPWWEYSPASRNPRGTIIAIHGGPESQARPDFDPGSSFLVGEGWRIIVPNVRGSMGYGRTFLHLDDIRKRMDSVRDIRDVTEALIRSRKAIRGKIGVVGGSYGGFMVLSSITTYPEYWGAAVELFGISNFVTFLELTADYRRALREVEYGSLADDRKFLESISPIHHLDRVRTPLFVLHGRNDVRVPIHEAEQIVEAVKRTGQPVEHLYFENEGHGFVRRENQIETARRTLDFFERYLPREKPARRRAKSQGKRR